MIIPISTSLKENDKKFQLSNCVVCYVSKFFLSKYVWRIMVRHISPWQKIVISYWYAPLYFLHTQKDDMSEYVGTSWQTISTLSIIIGTLHFMHWRPTYYKKRMTNRKVTNNISKVFLQNGMLILHSLNITYRSKVRFKLGNQSHHIHTYLFVSGDLRFDLWL